MSEPASLFYLHGKVKYIKYLERVGVTLIVAFMILLVSAAIFLALGDELTANKLAEIAYYMLVGGVVIQLIVVVKEGDKGEESK